jgi:hypothetical protein
MVTQADNANLRQFKRKFAELWLRNPSQPYQCILELIPDDRVKAISVMGVLTIDPEVKAIQEELLEEYGEEHFLPSKAQMVRKVLDRADQATEDGFIKMMKLAAEMRGFVDKTGVTINNNHTVNANRVMVIPSMPKTEDGVIDVSQWQQQALSQQATLTG